MAIGQSATFAEMLKRHRRAAGLSQAALAERAQLSRDGISALERGLSHTPRRDTIHLLLSALHLAPDEEDQLLAAAHAAPHGVPAERQREGGSRLESLPIPLTSLVGRDLEIDAIGRLLSREDVRLVTLTGAPGIGKTRLAIHVAWQMASAFPDGAVFVPLAPIREPAHVLPAIAEALSLRDGAESGISDQLSHTLRDCSLLLVLDNFERLVTAAPVLTELLGGCPRVKILVTSRCALRVHGEQEYLVPPLQTPDESASANMEVVSQNAAVSLFVQRAAAVQPEFSLTPQNAPDIAEICRILDGLPLAIELAAARLKLFWPATLLERLTPALPILTRGGQDLPERQQTMRSAIAWIYDLLDPQLQRFFRCFSIFGGGLTLDAAEQVCALPSEPAAPMLDVLAALMDQSLVTLMTANNSEPRFRLLSTLREFGIERLEECGETDDVASRHAQYFVELVEAVGDGEQSARQTPSPLHLEAERYNLRLAYDWAVQRGEHAVAERITKALAYFWWLGDDGARGFHWIETPIAHHDDTGAYH